MRPAIPAGRGSEAVEDYVKTIHLLAGRSGDPVPTTALARMLGVTPSSVCGMVDRLARDGLIEHVRYHGVRLTDGGEGLAREVLRHHRLVERYLVEELGMARERADREADALEHVLSPDLASRIATKLEQRADQAARGMRLTRPASTAQRIVLRKVSSGGV